MSDLTAIAKNILELKSPYTHYTSETNEFKYEIYVMNNAPALARAYLEMREALEWYANPPKSDEFKTSKQLYIEDNGAKARKVLEDK